MTMTMMTTTRVILLVLLSVVGVQCDKDDSYYKPGSGNPNTNQKMYWKDAENVLQDISKFETLYVEFQHCAWTWMNYQDDEEEEGSVDENDYWYMGKVAPFGANVAYSLYGSLKGESFSGCNSNTFINSFYTRTGFQEFVYAMTYAGVSKFTQRDFSGYSSECSGYSGVACDYQNGFAVHTFSTENCDPANSKGATDSMQYLNAAMQSAQCIQIYDRSSGYNYNGYNYTVYGTPLELLSYSEACFYQNYWAPDGQCPDPYNKIEFYQQNFNKGVTQSKKKDPFEQYTKQMQESKQLNRMGSLMLGAAGFILALGLLVPYFCGSQKQKSTSKSSSRKVLPTPPLAGEPVTSKPQVLMTTEQTTVQEDIVIIAPMPLDGGGQVEDAASTQEKSKGLGKKFRGMFGGGKK